MSILKKVLGDETLFHNDDVWGVVILSQPIENLRKAPLTVDYLLEKAGDVHIACTVTSRPEALITTHMGIETFSRTERQLSIPLHSFAAKVMLMRNPKRKYMINAPTEAMLAIMAKVLQKGSLFIGTMEMEKEILLKKEAQGKEWADLFKIYKQSKDFERAKENGATTFSKRDVLFWRDLYKAMDINIFFERLEKFPPIISDGGGAITVFDAHDRSKVFLKIERGNKIYDFIFAEPFRPTGMTYYIAVDLEALAAAS